MKITNEGWAVVEGDSHLSKWIEEHKTIEVAEGFCRLFSKYIPVGGAVADIGACLGDHTATYAKMVGMSGWVHAFECNPVALECLWKNMERFSNVIVHPIGLGDTDGTAKVVSALGENLGGSQLKSGYGGVRVNTLDEVASTWTKLNFVKIDAEGWEPRIIRGGMKTFAKFRPTLLVEVNRPVLAMQGFSDADIFVPLSSLGYKFQPCEPHLSMELPQIDVLCLPH